VGHYIVQQDLQDKLGANLLMQLTDKTGNNQIDSTVVNTAIDAAEGRFESYVRTRYTIPVPLTPLVKSLCVNLAIFELFQDSSSVDDGVYKVRKDAFDSAVKTLEAIHAGRAALDVPAAQETTSSPGSANPPVGASSVKKPMFTDGNLRDY
jgi:phage gp36-like protein